MNKHEWLQRIYDQHLSHEKREKRIVRLFQIMIMVLFFSLWEIASRFRWIDPLLFSSPSSVWHLLITKLRDHTLLAHTTVTLTETILGFIVGTIIGVCFATMLWWFPRVSKIVDPYLVILNAMPKVALGPILIVALGPNITSIVAMGAIISIIITTIVVYTSFKEVDANYIKVLQTFGATKRQWFIEAILPASFPTIISTLKVNVGLSWVGVIVGEFLVSKQGLGYMIIYGFQVFNFTLVLLSLLMIALLSSIMYQLVSWLEKKLVKRS
ncbi:ABC transporter permease [Anoxybacillus flavithermus]|uniref:Nitrate/sulfonate/bicarbonate ABC transporter permease n=1 Tax=Anoxybacillus flavithermus AK1 TaxID=1297581 RepID=M8D450_9BACL|nr:ABC transporter permease [Anoxybacillus flavithermus]EMT45591.1 nitrate/sulfonate/bicarbonate ABC transporter permease [Anoxybacillus flavithermus AK1]